MSRMSLVPSAPSLAHISKKKFNVVSLSAAARYKILLKIPAAFLGGGGIEPYKLRNSFSLTWPAISVKFCPDLQGEKRQCCPCVVFLHYVQKLLQVVNAKNCLKSFFFKKKNLLSWQEKKVDTLFIFFLLNETIKPQWMLNNKSKQTPSTLACVTDFPRLFRKLLERGGVGVVSGQVTENWTR